jgi:pyroglutamyl-peptidase
MTTLVTGFEPFGGSKVNTSELVVTSLAAVKERDVVTAVLPTSYCRAEANMSDLLHTHRPRTVLLLGLADGEPRIRFEQVALNLDDSEAPDNDGQVRFRRRIIEGAPVGYWNSLRLEQMADAVRHLHEDVVSSHDAGGYVCNHLFSRRRTFGLQRFLTCAAVSCISPPCRGRGTVLRACSTSCGFGSQVLRSKDGWMALTNEFSFDSQLRKGDSDGLAEALGSYVKHLTGPVAFWALPGRLSRWRRPDARNYDASSWRQMRSWQDGS